MEEGFDWNQQEDAIEAMFEDQSSDDDPEEDNDSVRKEDLQEGGDFHLKSALKSHSDLMSSYVYRNEYNKLSSYQVNQAKHLSPHQALQLLCDIGYEVNYQKNSGGSVDYLQGVGAYNVNIEEQADILEAELSVLVKYPTVGIRRSLKEAYRRMLSQIPNLYIMMIFVLSFLPIMNNIKNYRTHGIPKGGVFDFVKLSEGVLTYMFSPAFMILSTTDGIMLSFQTLSYYMPKTYFLNACDKIQERFNIIFYSILAEEMMVPLATPSRLIIDVINWGDDVITRFGNSGYDLIGNFEALLVGSIIEKDDQNLKPFPAKPGFLESVLEGLNQLYRPYANRLLGMISREEVSTIADIHGIYRIWGHPIVDLDGGMQKLRDNTMEDKVLTTEGMIRSEEGVRSFRRIFFMNFYSRHDVYPDFSCDDKYKKTYLISALLTNTKIDVKNILYDDKMWDHVIPRKQFSIPKTWNILHLAKDKSISPNRSEIFDLLVRTGSIFNANLRRGIIKLMSTPLVAMRDFLTDVATNGLSIKDCIIGLFPKERELKISARFFALMSFMMRVYFTATESLLGDKVLKYFPQITMSLNLLDMQKKMAEMSKLTEEQEAKITYVINMDFIKWNQQMRLSICEYIFKELDRIFGLPGLFTQTHRIFKQSVVYLADGCRKLFPDLNTGVRVDGKNSWQDAGAGKEGLRQKGWTIMTVCDIDAVAKKHSGKFQLVGGGDNQVLTVTYTTKLIDNDGKITIEGKNEIRRKLEIFLDDLEDHMTERKLPLKTSETWVSTSLFMYNKFMYYKGSPLRAPSKLISRAFPFSNTTTMSLSSMSQCLTTNLRSAMQKETIPHAILAMRGFWAQMLSSISEHNHPMTSAIVNHDQDLSYGVVRRSRTIKKVELPKQKYKHLWVKIACLPSCLGGPGSLNVMSVLMRGFPDPVTEGIAYLMRMRDSLHSIGSSLSNMFASMCGVSYGLIGKYNTLIEDPTSLNLDVPRGGAQEHRDLAKKALKSSQLMCDRDLKGLVSILNPSDEDNFYKALSSGTVLDVRVLHEIAGATLYAVTNTLTSRIEKTSTMSRLFTTMGIVKKMAVSELTYINYLLVRDVLRHDKMFIGCSRALADEARACSWGKRIIGVTVPTPFEYLEESEILNPQDVSSGVLVRLDDASLVASFTTMGGGKIYLGSYTKEKFKMTDIAAAYGDEDILSKSINLLKTVNWKYSLTSEMGELLVGPFKALTDIDVEPLIVDTLVTKGDYDHRKKTDARVHGGIPNFLPTCSSHANVITSTWSDHARGGKNENIHFQSVIITSGYRAILNNKHYNIGQRRSVLFRESCKDCIKEIENPNPASCSPALPVSLPTLVGNKLAYVSGPDIEFDRHVTHRFESNMRLGLGSLALEDEIEEGTRIFSFVWVLWLNMMGVMKTKLSYFVLQSTLGDMTAVISCLTHICRGWADFDNSIVYLPLHMDPFLQTFSSVIGLAALRDTWGMYLHGRLTGGFHFSSSDFWEGIYDHEVQYPRSFQINLALPKLREQRCLYEYFIDDKYHDCIICLNTLKTLWGNGLITGRLDGDYHCNEHKSERRPGIINMHFENIQRPTNDPQTEPIVGSLMVSPGNFSDDLEVISSTPGGIGCESIPILYRTMIDLDVMSLTRMIAGALSIYSIESIITTSNTTSITAIHLSFSMMGLLGEVLVFLLSDSLSYTELDAYVETKRSLPRVLSESILEISRVEDVPPGRCLHVYPDRKNLMSIPEGSLLIIPIHTLVEVSEFLAITKMYKLRVSDYFWVVLIETGSERHMWGDIIPSFIHGQHNNRTTCETDRFYINLLKSSDYSATLYMQTRRVCSWALFHNRYTLLKASERVKNHLQNVTKMGRSRARSKIKGKLCMTFIISILARTEEGGSDTIHKLSHLTYDRFSGVLRPVLLPDGVSYTHIATWGYFMKNYIKHDCDIQVKLKDVMIGVNLTSQRKEGFNIAGGQ